METAITTDALSVRFGRNTALDSVSLSIPRGIIFGFLGPNGAGKTTMIRTLLGLVEPSAGTAAVLGHDSILDADAVRMKSGALLEHTGLYERLTAADNLKFWGRVYRLPQPGRRDRIAELLDKFGLKDRADDLVGGWSRGMKQKLAVARAMLHRPEILFLDEPTAGLDPVAAASLRETLGGLVRDEGLTVFLTTHNLTEAEKLCPLVGVINRGKLVALDRPDSLSSRDNAITLEITGPVLPETGIAAIRSLESVSSVTAAPGGISITTTDGRDATPYIRVILEHGGSIEEVRWLANLEDVFLKLVEENAI